MEENAFLEFQKRVPMMPLESFLAAYRKAQDLYASYGITTVQEGLLRRELVPLYQALLADGSLKLDVVAYGDPEGAEAARQAFPESVRQYHRRFKLGGYKMFLDGSPQGRTAWLRQPYAGGAGIPGLRHPDGRSRCWTWSAGPGRRECSCWPTATGTPPAPSIWRRWMRRRGRAWIWRRMRPVMIHAQLLGRDQLPEVKRLGVIPSFFVAHVYHWGDVHLEEPGARPGGAPSAPPARRRSWGSPSPSIRTRR